MRTAAKIFVRFWLLVIILWAVGLVWQRQNCIKQTTEKGQALVNDYYSQIVAATQANPPTDRPGTQPLVPVVTDNPSNNEPTTYQKTTSDETVTADNQSSISTSASDHISQNCTTKLYPQAWLLLGLAGAYVLVAGIVLIKKRHA